GGRDKSREGESRDDADHPLDAMRLDRRRLHLPKQQSE
ncbi:MAG: hypothetical protein QOH26_149, partial [Actinomycetota bacterium]|nr:hypothetical protein [Actinomycetota bacterium]